MFLAQGFLLAGQAIALEDLPRAAPDRCDVECSECPDGATVCVTECASDAPTWPPQPGSVEDDPLDEGSSGGGSHASGGSGSGDDGSGDGRGTSGTSGSSGSTSGSSASSGSTGSAGSSAGGGVTNPD